MFFLIASHLTRTLAQVRFAPHDCLVVSARVSTPQRVVFPKVQLGSTLVGYLGIPDVFDRREYRDAGTLEIQVDGATVASASADVDDGWVRFEAPTKPGVADITVIASAAGRPDQTRKICFAAEARE